MKHQGRNQRKISGVAEVTFGNDYAAIDVQSTVMRPFCYDQLTNTGEPFSKWGHKCTSKKLWNFSLSYLL